MRVFISSVRRGLEEERDALPGLVEAVGHVPVRFEDFSAQNVPSREACLRGLRSSDAYLLVLGPNYGHTFPDTGQSPTHEEWQAATVDGKQRIVYRKQGVRFDDEQQELSREIGDYASGVFHDTFETTPELLTKVASKLRELGTATGHLNYQQLQAEPHVEWRIRSEGERQRVATSSVLELHVVPTDAAPYSARIFREISGSITSSVRRAGFVSSSAGIEQDSDDECIALAFPTERQRSWNTPQDEQILGLRVWKSGQCSVFASLPDNGMGGVLDPDRLPEQLANMLRMVGALQLIGASRVAVAAGIEPINMLSVERFDGQRSQSRSIKMTTTNEPLRIVPDESASIAALSDGALEVGQDVARGLIGKFQRLR